MKTLERVFRDAARKLESTDYTIGCCWAISQALDGTNDQFKTIARRGFAAMFQPREKAVFWWVNPRLSNYDKLARLIALDLAAEIAKEQRL